MIPRPTQRPHIRAILKDTKDDLKEMQVLRAARVCKYLDMTRELTVFRDTEAGLG